MNTYTIYRHSDGRLEAVAQGFSLLAMLAPPVWMAQQRLWFAAVAWIGVAAGLVVAYIELAMHQDGLQTIHIALGVGLVALFVVPGVQGRSWISSRLLGLGFEPERQVQAESAEAALQG